MKRRAVLQALTAKDNEIPVVGKMRGLMAESELTFVMPAKRLTVELTVAPGPRATRRPRPSQKNPTTTPSALRGSESFWPCRRASPCDVLGIP